MNEKTGIEPASASLRPADVQNASTSDQPTMPHRMTMLEILDAMTAPERMLETLIERKIDTVSIVDELALAESRSAEAMAALGPKVDGIWHVIDQFEAYAERTEARASKLMAKAKAAENEATRIRNRLLEQMELFQFEQLPGVEFKVKRIRAANPAMKVSRPATAEDLLLTPEYVSVVPEAYAWRNDVLKKSLVSGATHSFAAVSYSYRIEFVERDRPDVAPKAKGKRK